MDEKRKNKRTSMPSALVIKRLDGQSDEEEISVSIIDVSKSGIGFTSDEFLMIGEVYESFLTIWTKEVIHAFLQIVRIELQGNGFLYGAIFIGMSETDASRIEVYQTVHDQ